MTINVRFEDVQVGDALPDWSRTTGFMEWNRYAAVNDEFVPFHMEDSAGRRAGNEQGAFGMGNLRYAYIVNALREVEEGENRVYLDVNVKNQAGDDTCPGHAIVVLP